MYRFSFSNKLKPLILIKFKSLLQYKSNKLWCRLYRTKCKDFHSDISEYGLKFLRKTQNYII